VFSLVNKYFHFKPRASYYDLSMFSMNFDFDLSMSTSAVVPNFMKIQVAVDMKFPIHIHIHIHRRLSCIHVATKFPQSTAGANLAKWVHPPKTKTHYIPLLKLLLLFGTV